MSAFGWFLAFLAYFYFGVKAGEIFIERPGALSVTVLAGYLIGVPLLLIAYFEGVPL